MSSRSPVITGTGILSAAGCGVGPVWESLRAGREGLGPLTLFASARYGSHLVGQVRQDVDRLAREVRGSRSDKLAWLAAKEALTQALSVETADPGSAAPADLALQPFPRISMSIAPERRGVVLGSTVGGMLGTERFLARLLREQRHRCGELRFHECAGATDLCARGLEARGPCTTVSTACSAGAMAIAMAAEFIAAGEADFILAGGADSLCRLTLNGFGSLLLLDPNGCRPFDARRAGISLGEGAGMLVLEAEETARARGARILARVDGWGTSCDAFHPTAPHPEGRGALAAMQKALARAGLAPGAVDFVSAHGTGTPDNDAMEAGALRQLFGNSLPPVASVKRFFGHTLAASGAIKAVICVQALRAQHVPPNLGCEQPDPALGFEPVRQFQARPLVHVLSNSFGFGGNNVALLFSAPESSPTARVAGKSRPAGPSVSLGQPAVSTSRSGQPAFAVVGAGVISAAGIGLDQVFAAFHREPPPPISVELPPVLAKAPAPAYACGDFGAEQLLDAAKRRKLSRFQQMALVAGRQCLPDGSLATADPERVCVALGTGLGSLNDTAAFCENLILKEERAPRPLFFTNSVHNAQAAQVALELGLRGLNVTPVQREICFEAALQQGLGELRSGQANLALVGAADELSPYLLAAGMRWGRFGERTGKRQLSGDNKDSWRRLIFGEGAALFALARPDTALPRLASVCAVRIGRYGPGLASLDAEAEARWIWETLEGAGESEVDLLLTGANGWAPLEQAYQAVNQALSRLAGRSLACATYKPWCGEFHAASAFGFVTAVGLVRGRIESITCLGTDRQAALLARPCRKVLLYTLAPSGGKGMCCVCA